MPSPLLSHLLKFTTHENATSSLRRVLRSPDMLLAAALGGAMAAGMPLVHLFEQLGEFLDDTARDDLTTLWMMFGLHKPVEVAPPPPPVVVLPPAPAPLLLPPGGIFGGAA